MNMNIPDFVKKLDEADGFDELFRLVKRVVETKLGLRRAGLMLILGEIPSFILAYHEVGSNSIVLNRRVLRALQSLNRSKREINGYIFTVLLHEYLHTLGFLEERTVRIIVKSLTREILGTNHPAYYVANEDILKAFPEIATINSTELDNNFEIVMEFDSDSVTYIN
ncbi:MAG: hypothetical protein QXG97_01590 [Nitrososphaerota archaeon]